MEKTFEKGGGPSAPTNGHFAVPRRVNLHVYISFCSIHAYQISDFHLNNQKRGAFSPMPGPFPGPEGVSPYICISFYSILYEYYAYQISTFYLHK